MVYHNHSLKKARHYPVDTIRPPRLLRKAPRKGSNGGSRYRKKKGWSEKEETITGKMKERCLTQDKKKQSETQLGTSGLPHPHSQVGSPYYYYYYYGV